MAEWIFESGIGEDRAALIDDGRIIEVLIDPKAAGPRAGAVMAGRLRADRIVELGSGEEVLLDAAPSHLPEGALLHVLITREALPERGKPKRAKGRAVARDTPLSDAPPLIDRIRSSGIPVRVATVHDPDWLEVAGWSETLEEAESGEIAFPGGALRISLTPAMTLIDIDGTGGAAPLAIAGAQAAAAAIRCFDLAGSIGLDLPTLSSKTERLAVAEAFDRILPPPFERTAVNGFGFMQVIRPRRRASLCEQMQHDRAGCAARALLRRAERSGLTGAVTLVAATPVALAVAAHPIWLDQLSHILGGTAALRVDPDLAIAAGHVES